MRFRLVFYRTKESNKYSTENRFEFIGSRDAAYSLWYILAKELKYPHVEIYNLAGGLQEPEKGLLGLIDYNI